MAETTFGGVSFRGKVTGSWLAPMMMTSESEFVSFGDDIFTSEELTTQVYNIFLTLLSDGWSGQPREAGAPTLDEIFMGYVNGYYLPCTPRVALAGQVDRTNDDLPDYAGIVLTQDRDEWTTAIRRDIRFAHVTRLQVFPRGIGKPVAGPAYSLAFLYKDKKLTKQTRAAAGADKDVMTFFTWYFVVAPDGRIVPAVDNRNVRPGPVNAMLSATAAIAINLSADARFLWNVVVKDHVTPGNIHATPLTLGVSVEHVKSLFYARDLPVSESGRRRPILHWVQAHQRRIREGIEVDIRKHLRGVDRFEMDCLKFEIVNPRKGCPA